MDGALRFSGGLMMAVAVVWVGLSLNKPYDVRVSEESPSAIVSANEQFPGLAQRNAESVSSYYASRELAITLAPALFIAGATLLGAGVVAGALTARGSPAAKPGEADEIGF